MTKLVFRDKFIDPRGYLRELVVWSTPRNKKNPDGVRYRLAYIGKDKKPLIIYDNHHPKGHHKHIKGREIPYVYSSLEQLIEDFERDIEEVSRYEDLRD